MALHLIVIATFGISVAGITSVEEVALMVVNDHWLPFENIHELRLLEKLSHLKRKIVKGLRFNLPRDVPTVSVMMPEQKPAPVAMFIVPPSADDAYERALADMIETRPEITPWVWRVAEGEIPRSPDPGIRVSTIDRMRRIRTPPTGQSIRHDQPEHHETREKAIYRRVQELASSVYPAKLNLGCY